jgi:hypothetical protein
VDATPSKALYFSTSNRLVQLLNVFLEDIIFRELRHNSARAVFMIIFLVPDTVIERKNRSVDLRDVFFCYYIL